MPVDWSKYPDNWRDLVAQVRARSGDRCECRGECGTPSCASGCGAVNREPHPETGSKVVLTTAHLDHDTTHSDLSNLRHMCQRCHLAYDAQLHATHARQTRVRRLEDAGQQRLISDLGRCDCCGAASPTLIREPVEGVICERCPECRERGELP